MKDVIRDALATPLRAALRGVLVPLADVLQRFGIGYSQFCRAMLEAYVKAARDRLTTSGEKPTHSRIALMTGLTRQMVASGIVPRQRSSRPIPKMQIMEVWCMDPRYSDDEGRPIDLPFKGIRSFSELVTSCTTVFGPRTALDDFEAAGNVEVQLDGMIRLVDRAVIPADEIEFTATGLRNIGRHLQTIQHNLSAEPGAAMFERFHWSWKIPATRSASAIRELKQIAARATHEAEKTLDGLESEFDIEQHSVGLGAYVLHQRKD